MTAAGRTLELRQPLRARVWFVMFPLVVLAVTVFEPVPLQGDPGWALRALMCAFATALCWRLFRLAAVGTPDGRLVVRNHWRDRALHRDDVVDVAVARGAGGSNRSVRLTMRDGSEVRLDVTEHVLSRPVDRSATAVRGWLSGRPAPTAGDTR